MKKVLSIATLGIFALSLMNINIANAANTYNITPKAPKVSASLKPIIAKYRQGNYVGSMQDLEELVKKEKNNTYAKYYLALCYTRLGYKEEATALYNEIVSKDENLALSYYSQRALDCLENPDSAVCKPAEKTESEKAAELTDMDIFIQSGKKIHPAAMDRITKERMERKMIEEEYMRTQQQQQEAADGQLESYNAPTNEEIASALNTLSKIGLNPYSQFNPLAQAQQFNQFGISALNNPMMYGAMLNNPNQDMTRMLLYSQMAQQNNMLNYGI